MNTHDHHDDLHGEDELTSLYRSLPRQEPPAALDERVRRHAHDAVRPRNWRRWPAAAASAAVVVLAAGLGWRLHEQQPWTSMPATGTAAPAVAASQVATRQVTPPSPASHPANARHDAPADAAAPLAPPAPLTQAIHHAPLLAAKRPSLLAQNVAAPTTATPPAPVAEARAMAAPVASAAAPMATTAQAPSLPLHRYTAGPIAPVEAIAPAAPAPAVDPAASSPNDTPAQELDKIRLLFAQHRRPEALQRLHDFQQAHPGAPLPDDLHQQLPPHD